MKHTGLLIVGAGPGGYETALLAAGKGLQVTLVEADQVGGTCLNRGCIPTKSLCRSAEILSELSVSHEFGVSGLSYSFDFASALQRKELVVGQLRQGVETLLANGNITLVRGRASFSGPGRVAVCAVAGKDGDVPAGEPVCEEYSADNIIIASGSVPAFLGVPGNDLPGVLDSTGLLSIGELPGSLCIIGGGVIGLEFASAFRSFGSEVTVLEYCREVLPRFDRDVAKRLRQALGRRGIDVRTQAEVTGIARDVSGGLSVSYMRKNVPESVTADKVLMSVGRRPAVEGLNLEAAGVAYSARGISVDDNMMTTCPGIYAVGDVNGRNMLAHAAVSQGRRALCHILGGQDGTDLSVVPSVVFTHPEAASVGLTADDCAAAGIGCTEVKSFFRSNGKAVTMGETDGLCKIVAEVPSGRILGCHLCGPGASGLIAEMALAVSARLTIDDVRRTIHAHPTLSEVFNN